MRCSIENDSTQLDRYVEERMCSSKSIVFRLGFTAFCQTSNSSVRLLVNCLIVQSEPMKVSLADVGED